MKRLSISLITVIALLFVLTGIAKAETVWWEFTIDGADLMSYQTADGAVGDTAVETGLYEGARLYRLDEDLTGDNIINKDELLNKIRYIVNKSESILKN